MNYSQRLANFVWIKQVSHLQDELCERDDVVLEILNASQVDLNLLDKQHGSAAQIHTANFLCECE